MEHKLLAFSIFVLWDCTFCTLVLCTIILNQLLMFRVSHDKQKMFAYDERKVK
jgi:hypothetical protein